MTATLYVCEVVCGLIMTVDESPQHSLWMSKHMTGLLPSSSLPSSFTAVVRLCAV